MKMRDLTRAVVLLLLISILIVLFGGCATEKMNNIKKIKMIIVDENSLFVSTTGYKIVDEIATISELLNMFPDLQSISNSTRIKLSDIEDPWLRLVYINDNDEPTVSITVTDIGECYLYSEVDDFVYKMNNIASIDDLTEIYKNAKTVYGT